MSEPTSDQTAAVRRIVEEMRRYHQNALVHGATVEAWADRLLAALAAPPDRQERELCRGCHGNGVLQMKDGIRMCPRCKGDCWEPMITCHVEAASVPQGERAPEREK